MYAKLHEIINVFLDNIFDNYCEDSLKQCETYLSYARHKHLMYSPKIGVIHYHAYLGPPDKSREIPTR